MIRIPQNEIETFAQICAELRRQGIAFNAHLQGDQWEIELTGF